MKLYINTFGGFDIKFEGQTIIKESSRTYKLYKLFQYFLTFRGKRVLPETIIDNLWSDSESSDPKNMLRTQIFRLRKVIKEFLPPNFKEEDYIAINFINGYYCLDLGQNAVLDMDEFEALLSRGDDEYSGNADEAAILYEKAVKSYKGMYLSENAYEVWIVPTRNYYHRLYLKTLYRLIEILKNKKDYEKIISLCEDSLLIDSFEEDIHISLIEAMIKLGQSKSAVSHYDYAFSLLEREFASPPSSKFTELQRKLQPNSADKDETDIFQIKKELDNFCNDGPMYCEFDYFKFLFNIQKRKSLRNNENDYLGIISLNGPYGRGNNENSWNIISWMENMQLLLEKSLRRGDIYTLWNNKQILILLHNVKGDGISCVKERIKKTIKSYSGNYGSNTSITFQPVISEDIII